MTTIAIFLLTAHALTFLLWWLEMRDARSVKKQLDRVLSDNLHLELLADKQRTCIARQQFFIDDLNRTIDVLIEDQIEEAVEAQEQQEWMH